MKSNEGLIVSPGERQPVSLTETLTLPAGVTRTYY